MRNLFTTELSVPLPSLAVGGSLIIFEFFKNVSSMMCLMEKKYEGKHLGVVS